MPVSTLEIPPYSMLFNDGEFIITNIAKNDSAEITLFNTKMSMRPVPPKRKDMPVSVTYTAQNLCEKDEFETFYIAYLGKSIKMDFEDRTYYGYLTNLQRGEFDVTFTFTYTSNIPHIPEDPGFWWL